MVMMLCVAVVCDWNTAFEQRELGDIVGWQRCFRRRNFRVECCGYGVRHASRAQALYRANAITAAQNNAPLIALLEKRAATTLALYPPGDGVLALDGYRHDANDRIRLLPRVLDDACDLRRIIGNRRVRRQQHNGQRRGYKRPHHFTCTPA